MPYAFKGNSTCVSAQSDLKSALSAYQQKRHSAETVALWSDCVDAHSTLGLHRRHVSKGSVSRMTSYIKWSKMFLRNGVLIFKHINRNICSYVLLRSGNGMIRFLPVVHHLEMSILDL